MSASPTHRRARPSNGRRDSRSSDVDGDEVSAADASVKERAATSPSRTTPYNGLIDEAKLGEIRERLDASHWSEAARFLKLHTKVPPVLYKFMRIKSRGLRSAIVDSKLWLSSPDDFNDPFDCQARPSTEGTPAQQRRYVVQQLLRDGVKKSEVNALASRFLAEGLLTPRILHAHAEMTRLFGISCMSQKFGHEPFTTAACRSILMWSHYTDSHRGVCLQFRPSRSAGAFLTTFKVEYCDDYFTIPMLDLEARNDVLTQPIARKATAWKYEHEHRIVVPGQARSLLSILPRALTGIIFGCRSGRCTELRVAALCRRRRAIGLPPIRLFRAQRAPDSYRLIVRRALDLEAMTLLL